MHDGMNSRNEELDGMEAEREGEGLHLGEQLLQGCHKVPGVPLASGVQAGGNQRHLGQHVAERSHHQGTHGVLLQQTMARVQHLVFHKLARA